MPDDTPDDLVQMLDEALDRVLQARLQAGGTVEVAAPDEALTAALVADRGSYRQALRRHQRLYEKLRPVVDPDHRDLLIDLADSGNAMASAAVDIGFRVGFTAAVGGVS